MVEKCDKGDGCHFVYHESVFETVTEATAVK
jgi:hypothetical protein